MIWKKNAVDELRKIKEKFNKGVGYLWRLVLKRLRLKG